MEFKREEEDERNTVGEVAVAVLFWISILLGLGTLVHKWFFQG